jgi:hypothetical protein
MRNLGFNCECGEGYFMTKTDNLSYMAHFIPDQENDAFSGIVDDAIEKSGPTARDKGRACMEWRSYTMLSIWRCYACGAVYVEAPDGSHHRFLPAAENVTKQLFKRRRFALRSAFR